LTRTGQPTIGISPELAVIVRAAKGDGSGRPHWVRNIHHPMAAMRIVKP